MIGTRSADDLDMLIQARLLASIPTSSQKASSSIESDPKTEARAQRAADLAARSAFEAKDTFEPARGSFSRPKGFDPTSSIPSKIAPPAFAGRGQQPETNAFAPNVAPASMNGAAGIAALAEDMAKGLAVPVGPDNAARLAAIKAEADASIGHHTGPDRTPSGANVASDWMEAGIRGATNGATAGAAAGMVAATITGGAATPLIVVGAARGAGVGFIGGVLSAAAVDAYQAAKKHFGSSSDDEPADATPTPTPTALPGGVKEDESSATPKEGTSDGDAGAGSAGNGLGPGHHGDGRSYEAFVEAYFGNVAGTNFGLRDGNSYRGPGADPRKSNPGRDLETDEPSGASGPTMGERLTMSHDPLRGARDDARAANLMSMKRVSGRHIITDPNADSQGGAVAVPPRRNPLT